MSASPQRLTPTRTLFALSFAFLLSCIGWWWYFGNHEVSCDPKAAELHLSTYRNHGIERVHHPPSLSNLLWITVGPEWHALAKKDKDEVDKIVRCAATTIDELGEPTWQAAYYDGGSGKLVALTSKKYGFRLEPPSAP